MTTQSLFNIKLGRIWTNPERYFNERIMTKGLHQYLTVLWKKAIKAYGIAMLSKVHVDTGMSAASMFKMAKDFKFLLQLRVVLATKKHETRSGHSGLYGRWASNNMAQKSETAGEILSENFYSVSYGTPSRAVLKFKVELTVFQWWLHENPQFLKYPSGGMWGALRTGEEAFHRAIKKNWNAEQLKTEFKNWALKGLITSHPEDE